MLSIASERCFASCVSCTLCAVSCRAGPRPDLTLIACTVVSVHMQCATLLSCATSVCLVVSLGRIAQRKEHSAKSVRLSEQSQRALPPQCASMVSLSSQHHRGWLQDLKLGPWVSEATAAAAGGGDEGAYDLFALAAHQHDPKLAYPSDDRQGRLVPARALCAPMREDMRKCVDIIACWSGVSMYAKIQSATGCRQGGARLAAIAALSHGWCLCDRAVWRSCDLFCPLHIPVIHMVCTRSSSSPSRALA